MGTDHLDGVYGALSPEEARAIYDTWSKSYDADNLARGFRLPFLGAGLLASFLGRSQGPLLDAGCGTGLVGDALRLMGYGHVFGCDLSPEMLARAEQSGAYAGLAQTDMGAGLPYEDNHFAGFACIGSFGPGHAPPATLTHLARATRPGGYTVSSICSTPPARRKAFLRSSSGSPPTANGRWRMSPRPSCRTCWPSRSCGHVFTWCGYPDCTHIRGAPLQARRMSAPSPVSNASKIGNDVAMGDASSTLTGFCAASPSTRNDIAMR